VIEGSSTDRMLRALDEVMPKVVSGMDRVHEVSVGGRKWALGTLEDKMLDADKWLDEGHVERPLEKADQAIRTMESAVLGASTAVNGARGKVNDTLDRVENGIVAARKQMAEAQVGVHNSMESIRHGMDGLDKPVDDLAEVIQQVNEGRGSGPRGTLGRLINDPSMGDSIEAAAESGKEFTESATRFQSFLGLRTEFNVLSRAPRFFVTAEVRARPDKFYYIELERGPLGDVPDDSLTNSIGTNVWTRHQEIHDRVRFTFQFGKELASWLQVRGGIKESTFGIGADVLLRNGKLKLSADAYGASTYIPRVKLAAALLVFRSIYIVGGIDDALNKSHDLNIVSGANVPHQFDEIRYGRDYFLGAELHFDDEDLSFLLRVYGAMLVGLL
jgi:phospholipid/cholesterol/gamma-HCH transport system substrate-binding protein